MAKSTVGITVDTKITYNVHTYIPGLNHDSESYRKLYQYAAISTCRSAGYPLIYTLQ